ncbi:MAG: hypothetical protein AAGA78_05060, partial [Pseudomonadota bacterium]
PFSPEDLLKVTLQRIQDALDLVASSNTCRLNDMSLEVKNLRTTLERYSNDASRIEMDLMDAARSLSLDLKPEDDDFKEVSHLRNICLTGALDIRGHSPEIEEARAKRKYQRKRELSEDRSKQIARDIEEALPELVAYSDEHLTNELSEDVRSVVNDLLKPVSPNAPTSPVHDPALRLTSNVAQMNIQMRADGFIERVKKSTAYKFLDVGSKLNWIVGLLLATYVFFG